MARRLKLFEAAGLELEYMIVDRQTGAVAPVVDQLIQACRGRVASDCAIESCEASNELAAHVFELKVPRPVKNFDQAERRFVRAIRKANTVLAKKGYELLSGPMHPTMDPAVESGLWKHEGREVYEFYDKVFNCRRHGWLNLQSCHINLPFSGDREFGMLHAAVILLLPMLPALAAGSPFREGKKSRWLDERLKTYANNQNRFPLIAGRIVPEPVFTEADYRERIFEPLGRQVAPINKKGILQREWLNSRGAIARFDRGAIEIRVLDVQECPRADMAIAHLIFATLRALIAEKGQDLIKSATHPITEKRRTQFLACARHGFSAPLSLPGVREVFELPRTAKTAHDFWKHIHGRMAGKELSASHSDAIAFILKRGNLAQRLLRLRDTIGPRRKDVYPRIIRELADCLNENRLLG